MKQNYTIRKNLYIMANLSLQGQNHYLQDKVCKQLKRNKQLETESCNISSKLEITASTTS